MKSLLKSILVLSIFLSITHSSFSQTNNTTCTDLKNNLIYKMQDSNVLSLQVFLYNNGYLNVTPTGYFGNATVNAVKTFQSANGLESVGNVGKMTRAVIRNQTCAITNTQTQTSTKVNTNIQTKTHTNININTNTNTQVNTNPASYCPANSTYRSSNNTCVCNTGYSVSVSGNSCTISNIVSNTQTYSPNTQNHTCQTNATWDGRNCTCNIGYVASGVSCVYKPVLSQLSCPANSTLSGSTCVCNAGYTMMWGSYCSLQNTNTNSNSNANSNTVANNTSSNTNTNTATNNNTVVTSPTPLSPVTDVWILSASNQYMPLQVRWKLPVNSSSSDIYYVSSSRDGGVTWSEAKIFNKTPSNSTVYGLGSFTPDAFSDNVSYKVRVSYSKLNSNTRADYAYSNNTALTNFIPTLGVQRFPSTISGSESWRVSILTQFAKKLEYDCGGKVPFPAGWNDFGAINLPERTENASNLRAQGFLGTYNCVWRATSAGGETRELRESFTINN